MLFYAFEGGQRQEEKAGKAVGQQTTGHLKSKC